MVAVLLEAFFSMTGLSLLVAIQSLHTRAAQEVLPGEVLKWMSVDGDSRRAALGMPHSDDRLSAPTTDPRRFTAFCDCPKCGHMDHHLLREPKPAPSEAEMQEWRRTSTTSTIQTWDGHTSRTDTWPPPPVDESQFEVIRICIGCQHEWGQM